MTAWSQEMLARSALRASRDELAMPLSHPAVHKYVPAVLAGFC